jgi:G:T-mismatch repair DNA endonuclease (very short patch repair protein)
MKKSILFVEKKLRIDKIGFLYLSSVLKAAGHAVDMIQDDIESIDEYLAKNPTDYVMYSVMTGEHLWFINKNKELKKKHKFISVVGGPHFTFFPEQGIDDPDIDYVVQGPGENVILDIIDGVYKGTKFIVGHLPDVNSLPHPDRTILYKYDEFGLAKMKRFIAARYCNYSCFVAGTKIATLTEPNKRIENIKVGDKLIGFDEEQGILKETEVVNVFNKTADKTLVIKFENGKKIQCTENHPFYVLDKWVEAKDLKINDEIYNIDGHIKSSLMWKLYNPTKNKEIMDKIIAKKDWSVVSERMKKNNPMFNKDSVIKAMEHRDNSIISERLKERWKEGKMHGHPVSEENKIILSEKMKLNNPMHNQDTLNKKVKTFKDNYKNKKFKLGGWSKQREWAKNRMTFNNPMKDSETAHKVFSKRYTINKSEKKLEQILDETFYNEYKFVGDGKLWIENCNPDFITINKDKKKIIELNGCYWHGCQKCYPGSTVKSNHKRKTPIYRKHGFKFLYIWEHELKNKLKLIK